MTYNYYIPLVLVLYLLVLRSPGMGIVHGDMYQFPIEIIIGNRTQSRKPF